MRLTEKKLPKEKERELKERLYQLLIDIKNEKEAMAFCRGILSPGEEMAIAKRLGIFTELEKGASYAMVRKLFLVSPATVARFKRQVNQPEVKLIIKKIAIDEWAGNWEKKIKKLIKAS